MENITVIFHDKNMGKGAALKSGFAKPKGEILLVQDADLEYDSQDYGEMLTPIIQNKADVVFGSRFFGGKPHRVLYFWHRIANGSLTLLSNIFTDLNLTDMECGFKAFKKDVIQSIHIRENRFGFEPEITAKIAILNVRVYEVGVSYYGRTYSEGKKIGWRDGGMEGWSMGYNLYI